MLNYYCRQSKAGKDGLSPVEMSININGKREYITLPYKRISSEDFLRLKNSKKKNSLTDYLNSMTISVNNAINAIISAGEPLTVQSLKEYLKTGGIRVKTVKEVFDEWLGIQEQRIDKEITLKVYNKYLNAIEVFYEVAPATTDIKNVTNSTIQQFYLTLQDRYRVNTAATKMTTIKSIFTFAFLNGYITKQPFNQIHIHREDGKIEFLNKNEMKKLKTVVLSDKLDRVRDLAIFQASTGLSYCDMAAITPEDIKCLNGVYYIDGSRIKTDADFTCIILEDGMRVWNKYNGSLPIISNQKYNDYLKIIQQAIGVTKNLHTHLFRKTYGCFLLNAGANIKQVATALGHKKVSTTEKYYAKLDNEILVTNLAKIVETDNATTGDTEQVQSA